MAWDGEPQQKGLWFNYNAHRQIHSVRFACEVNGKILFNYIYFFNSFLLQANVFRRELRPMKLFVETHI
jgi:hypothetical protein